MLAVATLRLGASNSASIIVDLMNYSYNFRESY
jgi:hypothetical protein